MDNTCVESGGKVKYNSKYEVSRNFHYRKGKTIKSGAYKCKYCKCWHRTSNNNKRRSNLKNMK